MPTGALYSYLDTVTPKPAISDAIFMLDWQELALLRLLGFAGGNASKLKLVNWPATKVTWLEDSMTPLTTTIAEDLDDNEAGIDVATGKGAYFRQGDMCGLYLNGAIAEKVLVKSVASDTLTVERGYGGTSGTTHSTGATIAILTRAMPEGNGFVTGYSTVPTLKENYVQIISQAAQVSKTEQAISRFGIKDQMARQVSKLFADGGGAGLLPQMLQQTFYHGEKVARDASNYGSMGGFKSFVTTNVTNLSGAPIERSHIHEKIRTIRTANGRVTHLVCGAWGYEKITAMYEDNITYSQDTTLGGSEITKVKTPHGQVQLVYDWMCPEDQFFFVNAAKCGWLPLRPFEASKIAEQGDYYVRDIVGEFTFFLVNELSHGYIYGASTTS